MNPLQRRRPDAALSGVLEVPPGSCQAVLEAALHDAPDTLRRRKNSLPPNQPRTASSGAPPTLSRPAGNPARGAGSAIRARILDPGLDDQPFPNLVLQFVDGVQLARFTPFLSLNDRIGRLIQIRSLARCNPPTPT